MDEIKVSGILKLDDLKKYKLCLADDSMKKNLSPSPQHKFLDSFQNNISVISNYVDINTIFNPILILLLGN